MLDEWFEQEVKPRLKGYAFLVRYADDFVMGFTQEQDARRVMDVLPKRFEKYGLTLHPEKTRLVPFERPGGNPNGADSRGARTPPGTFDLLGFTHYWGRSRKGEPVVKQKTSKNRINRGLKAGAGAVAPQGSPHRPGRPAPNAESEASGALRVLRDHGQLASVEPVPTRGHRTLEVLAEPSRPRQLSLLGSDVSSSAAAIRCRRRSPSTRCAVS